MPLHRSSSNPKFADSMGSKIIIGLIIIGLIYALFYVVKEFNFLNNEELKTQNTAAITTDTKLIIRWNEKVRGERKHRIYIKELTSTKFVFTVGSSKNQMWFNWDKTKNPDHGVWYRAGTDYKGIWELKKVTKGGKVLLAGYHTFEGETYDTYIEMM